MSYARCTRSTVGLHASTAGRGMLPRSKRFALVKCKRLSSGIEETLGTGLQTPSRLKLVLHQYSILIEPINVRGAPYKAGP